MGNKDSIDELRQISQKNDRKMNKIKPQQEDINQTAITVRASIGQVLHNRQAKINALKSTKQNLEEKSEQNKHQQLIVKNYQMLQKQKGKLEKVMGKLPKNPPLKPK